MIIDWAMAQSISQQLGTASWFLDQLKSTSSPGRDLLQWTGYLSLPAMERRVPAHLLRSTPRTGIWGQTLLGLTFLPRPQTLSIKVGLNQTGLPALVQDTLGNPALVTVVRPALPL